MITISKSLIHTTINQNRNELIKLIKANSSFTIDLGSVSQIDSSAIALLVELKSIAKRYSCDLNYINHTPIIERLCQLYKISL